MPGVAAYLRPTMLDLARDERRIGESLLETAARELVLRALVESRGNCRRAAESLGVTPRVIEYEIRQLGFKRYKEGDPEEHRARILVRSMDLLRETPKANSLLAQIRDGADMNEALERGGLRKYSPRRLDFAGTTPHVTSEETP